MQYGKEKNEELEQTAIELFKKDPNMLLEDARKEIYQKHGLHMGRERLSNVRDMVKKVQGPEQASALVKADLKKGTEPVVESKIHPFFGQLLRMAVRDFGNKCTIQIQADGNEIGAVIKNPSIATKVIIPRDPPAEMAKIFDRAEAASNQAA